MISDSGKYSGFGYPDIRIPVEITSRKLLLGTNISWGFKCVMSQFGLVAVTLTYGVLSGLYFGNCTV